LNLFGFGLNLCFCSREANWVKKKKKKKRFEVLGDVLCVCVCADGGGLRTRSLLWFDDVFSVVG
jgi:hypothetical protein